MAFSTNMTASRSVLEKQSYIHLQSVLSERFVALLEDHASRIAANESEEIAEWHIPGKKRQFLFDFPSRDFLDGFRAGLADLTGMPADGIIISERHIKVYLDEAGDFPPPHIDRRAAEYTIGFPIRIPDASRVCFFPHFSREENQLERAVYADVSKETDMAAYYGDDRIVKIKGDIGDMIIFSGSTIYHERIRPAGSMILYIKVNASGRDPLGEHASLLASFEAKSAELIGA